MPRAGWTTRVDAMKNILRVALLVPVLSVNAWAQEEEDQGPQRPRRVITAKDREEALQREEAQKKAEEAKAKADAEARAKAGAEAQAQAAQPPDAGTPPVAAGKPGKNAPARETKPDGGAVAVPALAPAAPAVRRPLVARPSADAGS